MSRRRFVAGSVALATVWKPVFAVAGAAAEATGCAPLPDFPSGISVYLHS
jgi:hypothetical protein